MSDGLVDWLVRITAAFDENEIPYAVVGGLGLAAWGCARATTDLDLVIASSANTVDRSRVAAGAAGLLQARRGVIRFKKISMLRMVAAPSTGEAFPVDLLLVPTTLEAGLLSRVTRVPLGTSRAAFASPEDIMLLKLLRYSDQDRVDIRALAERNRLDKRYVAGRARSLRVLGHLRDALPAWRR